MNIEPNYTGLRKILWPIDNRELKKFLPMAFMMFFILFNYSMTRSIKDAFVVTEIGAEAISFTKLAIVLPCAILAMVIYSKLNNSFSSSNVFYIISLSFGIYFALYAFYLFPNAESLHLDQSLIERLTQDYPRLKWFIRIAGKWTLASFYVMSELWGSVMLSLLFWQFANNITKTTEARRFYAMFGLLGNFGLILTGYLLDGVLGKKSTIPTELGFKIVISCAILSVFVICFLYKWINDNVLTDPVLYDPSSIGGGKKKKEKLGLAESFKVIFTSKYLGLIAILVISYGISINLVEGVWKDKLKELYPLKADYSAYMGNFQKYQGWVAIFFMLIGSNILRAVSWRTAAVLTPLMILLTGSAFFGLIFFGSTESLGMAHALGTNPLVLAVTFGAAQNILSKATKYSLFDSTKEMSYIPLDDVLKSKGKAAVDVVGGRLGKSGGAMITSIFFMIFKDSTFKDATPYFAVIFFVIMLCWIYAVNALSKEYYSRLEDQTY